MQTFYITAFVYLPYKVHHTWIWPDNFPFRPNIICAIEFDCVNCIETILSTHLNDIQMNINWNILFHKFHDSLSLEFLMRNLFTKQSRAICAETNSNNCTARMKLIMPLLQMNILWNHLPIKWFWYTISPKCSINICLVFSFPMCNDFPFA